MNTSPQKLVDLEEPITARTPPPFSLRPAVEEGAKWSGWIYTIGGLAVVVAGSIVVGTIAWGSLDRSADRQAAIVKHNEDPVAHPDVVKHLAAHDVELMRLETRGENAQRSLDRIMARWDVTPPPMLPLPAVAAPNPSFQLPSPEGPR